MRSPSFIYIVEINGVKKLVRHTSPGRAIKAAQEPVTVIARRASIEEVAMMMGDGADIIDGTKQKLDVIEPSSTNGGKRVRD
jgi:hypothetical protein